MSNHTDLAVVAHDTQDDRGRTDRNGGRHDPWNATPPQLVVRGLPTDSGRLHLVQRRSSNESVKQSGGVPAVPDSFERYTIPTLRTKGFLATTLAITTRGVGAHVGPGNRLPDVLADLDLAGPILRKKLGTIDGR